ncbi:hypothetical protein SERLA73DRAFT_69145 [Serpula lacrymans var. lacrymans S7.3]|uniref:DUF8040 domain-containing protein n=1 Tax=Serpula lacrymans var. lacrymans (strain S7.3) TaxID=936435 RepID=F8PJP0_SERL3|nr:hypothetical protein SERLA73DRAFT_69145 [Serpula lacrymans var. lacrymans S7.3]
MDEDQVDDRGPGRQRDLGISSDDDSMGEGEEGVEESEEVSIARRRHAVIFLCAQQLSLALISLQTVAQSAALVATNQLDNSLPQPYHTSILTGHGWVLELLQGHPDRIHAELGVRRHVFLNLEEQLAIFLYTSVIGLSVRHLGE